MATHVQSPPRRRLRKRYLIPLSLLALLVVLFAWVYWRGTAAESAERNPRTLADGPVTQLLTRDGQTSIRCALVVDAPPAAVWKVITDYDSQEDFLPYLGQIASRRLDDGRVQITGIAHSRIWGDWPFESVVTEKEDTKNGEYTVTWDEKDRGGFAINRGSWALSPVNDGTLLVYHLQTEMQGYPPFLVRNVIMNRLGGVLRAVRDEVHRRGRA